MTTPATHAYRLLRGGLVVWPERVARAEILLHGERIAGILAPETATEQIGVSVESIDVDGLLVLPGLIDTHVHFATGTSHVDTLPEAATGGALGGLTTLVGHVRSTQGDIIGEIQRQRALVAHCPIDVSFHAILDPEEDAQAVVPKLAAMGVRSFKFFMAYRRDGVGMDDTQLFAALQAVAGVGGVALVHAEDEPVIESLESQLQQQGRTAITDYPASRPPETEVEAIRRALHLAELAGAALYFVHVSTAHGLRLIRQEKERHRLGERPPVYAESCPQYLLLDESVYATLGSIAKIAPPIRPESHRRALYHALHAGLLDALGSDHSPHPLSAKQAANFLEVRAGAPGVQTLVPLLVSALLAENTEMDAESLPAVARLALCMSRRPAQILGLAPDKGEIAAGAHADLVLVDPDAIWQLDPSWLVSGSGFSLFAGRAMRGRPLHSLVRGRWVLRHGELIAQGGGLSL